MTYYRRFDQQKDRDVFSLDLRESDKEEARAFLGISASVALANSILGSEDVWVVIYDNNIEGVFGVCQDIDKGIPWFVATERYNDFKITFAKESKKVVHSMLLKYKKLENFVSSIHKQSIRWLSWLDFALSTTDEYIFFDPNIPFYKFSKEVE